MTIKEAVEILEKKKSQNNDEKLQNRIDSLINDLREYFGDSDVIDQQIAKTIQDCNTSLVCINYAWIMHLSESFMLMKRRSECRNYLSNNKGKIDGETAQWVTTVAQGVIGIVSAVFAVLFAMGIIPNVFGKLGESQNTDAFYYVIGTIGQQAIALAVGIIIGIINKCRIKKKYKNLNVSFEELLAVKYEDNLIRLRILSPIASEISGNIIVAIGKNSQASGRDSNKTSGDNSPIISGNGNL